MSSQIKNITKKIVINAYKNQLNKEMRLKMGKKGVLAKIIESNSKRTKCLSEILKESDNLNILSNSKSTKPNEKMSDDDFLKKYHSSTKGGPKHSIAINRAHHLSNFLSEYIINAFQSGIYQKPDIPDHLNQKTDSNGFLKETYSFELSNIELQANLNFIRINWLCSDNEDINEYVENYLEKSLKSQIRVNLTSERVLNYVPQILFVRDNTNVLMKKLDEHLMKIKLENQMDEKNEQQNQPEQEKSNDSINREQNTTEKINNLYGVDFNRLIESLKGGSSPPKHLPWSPNSETNSQSSLEAIKPADVLNRVENDSFLVNLKAFQINNRIKNERRAKSALNKLSQLEYEKLIQDGNI